MVRKRSDGKKTASLRKKTPLVDGVYGCPMTSDKLRSIPLMNLIPCRFHPFLSKLPKSFLMFLGYSFAGGLATLLDLILFTIWTLVLGWPYQWGIAVSYGIAMIVNFVLQKLLIFRNKSMELVSQFGMFCLVAMVGLGLTYILMIFQVEVLKTNPVLAKVIAVPIVLVWNFLANKQTTFRWFK